MYEEETGLQNSLIKTCTPGNREHGASLEKMGIMENMDRMENMEKNASFCWNWIENIIRIFVESKLKGQYFSFTHSIYVIYRKGWKNRYMQDSGSAQNWRM